MFTFFTQREFITLIFINNVLWCENQNAEVPCWKSVTGERYPSAYCFSPIWLRTKIVNWLGTTLHRQCYVGKKRGLCQILPTLTYEKRHNTFSLGQLILITKVSYKIDRQLSEGFSDQDSYVST